MRINDTKPNIDNKIGVDDDEENRCFDPCLSHSVKIYTSEGSTLHSQKCSACGYKQKFAEHYAETAGYGTCLACGYVGYITIGINKTINVIE